MKTWRWLGLLLCAGLVGATACKKSSTADDDDTSTTSTHTGAGGGTTTTTVTGSGTTAACYDGSAAAILWGDTVGLGQNACSMDQITGNWTACWGSDATQASCDAWVNDTANAACFTCLLGGSTTGPLPVFLMGVEVAWLAQVACTYVRLGSNECAYPAQAYYYCDYTACEACSGDSGAEEDCWAIADADACADALAAIPTTCETPTALDPACDGADFQDVYYKIAALFCGPPV